MLRNILWAAVFLLSAFSMHVYGSSDRVADSLQQLVTSHKDSLKVVYLLKQGNYHQNKNTTLASHSFHEALSLSRKLSNQPLIARCYFDIGNLYNGTGDYTKALRNFTKALEMFENLNDFQGLAKAHNSIGNMYTGQGNNELAEKYYKRALAFSRRAEDEFMIAISSYGLANCLSVRKKYDQSITAFDEAARIFKKRGDKFEYSAVRISQADIYIEQNRLEKAFTALQEALPIMKSTGDQYGTSQALKQLAHVYILKNQPTRAVALLQEALQMCRSIGARDNVKDIYQRLARLYKKTGELALAYDYMERFAALHDSLFNEENARETAALQEKYESAKKEKELIKKDAALKKEQALTRQQSAEKKTWFVGFLLMAALMIVAFIAYRQNRKAAREISLQKIIIEEKNKDITASIRYAYQIQQSLLPALDDVKEKLGDFFIYFQPKDIVSGDFYWVGKKNNRIYIAAADCTGHGVPGAFMSMLGFYALDSALKSNEVSSPAELLDHLHHTIVETFRKKQRTGSVQDGMDISVCSFDLEKRTLEFAAANNRVYIVNNNQLSQIKGNYFSIGNAGETRKFRNQSVTLRPGDNIYLFSDGFASQFGGASGKKLKYIRMREWLLKYSHLSMPQQQENLQRELREWRGGMEQIDDILLMGIRIS